MNARAEIDMTAPPVQIAAPEDCAPKLAGLAAPAVDVATGSAPQLPPLPVAAVAPPAPMLAPALTPMAAFASLAAHLALGAAMLWFAIGGSLPAGEPAEVIEVELVAASAASAAPTPPVEIDVELPPDAAEAVIKPEDIDPSAIIAEMPPETPQALFTPQDIDPAAVIAELPPEAPKPVFELPKPVIAPLAPKADDAERMRLAQQQEQLRQEKQRRERQQQERLRQEKLKQEKLRREATQARKLAEQRKAEQKKAAQQRAAAQKAAQARNGDQQSRPARGGERGASMGPAAFSALVAARVRAAMTYPASARARGATGVATVTFALTSAGAPSGARIAASSGHADLDAAALAAVRRVRLPPPPPGASRSFTAPMRFNQR